MSRWLVIFVPEASRDLDKLPTEVKDKIIQKLEWLQQNFDQVTPLALGGSWAGYCKLRIGDYRIVWSDRRLFVVAANHRSRIYKER